MSAMRTWLALAAAALSGVAVLVSALDDAQEALAFFVAATIVALGQARLGSDASSAARRGAWFIAVVWILAGAWIGVLLLMYQTASRATPGPEATYLGLTATVYHLVALYGGMVLVTLAAWLPPVGTAPRAPGAIGRDP